MTIGNYSYYYVHDILGSIIALTDENGQVVVRYEYDAWGNIIGVKGGDIKNRYMYTGREYDSESGLYYYRARYYDAVVGRFISKDPVTSYWTSGANLYIYVNNMPVRSVDPYGEWWFWRRSKCNRYHKFREDIWYMGHLYNKYKENDKWAHCFVSGYLVRYYYWSKWVVYHSGIAWEYLEKAFWWLGGKYSEEDVKADYIGAYICSNADDYCESVAHCCERYYHLQIYPFSA